MNDNVTNFTKTEGTTMALLKRLLCLLPGLALALTAPAQAGEIITYVHTDHLGSPVLETDASGQIVRHEVYGPYGDAQISPGDDNIGYTGHVQDGDTGLVYMQARYYDPVLGRFLSVDPVTFGPGKPQHFNRYWYANGNPYLYTDPDGREPGDFAAGFSMGLMFNEEQTQKILAAEAACQICGSELSGGIAAGQATGTLLENGLSVEGVVLAVGKIGGRKASSRSARRSAMRQRNDPTSRGSVQQSQGSNGLRQHITIGSDGRPVVQTQHASDAQHLNPHWHAGNPKVDDNGNMQTNSYGQVRDKNEGRTTVRYDE